MLITKAVKPLVAKVKSDFVTVIISASGRPNVPAANMVIMFENPGFAPGGRKGISGMRLSIKFSAMACAQSRAQSAGLKFLSFFIFSISQRIELAARYAHNGFCRQANCGVALF